AHRTAENRFREWGQVTDLAVARLADPNDSEIHELLIDLKRGPLEEQPLRELAQRARALMRERGLSVLELLSADGRVLACGHVPARAGENDPDALARARRWEGRPLLVEEQVFNGEKLEPALAVESARWARLDGGGAVLVVGGKLLDAEFLKPL